ncbi:MAG: anhydro-N-acetylmuramic acid kinase [Bacteroidales bacterium]
MTQQLQFQSPIAVLGLMSGSSLDGLDLVLCHFTYHNSQWHYEILAAQTVPYPNEIKKRLHYAIYGSAIEYVSLDIELGRFMASSVNEFLKDRPIKPILLASHGHTIFHQPQHGITSQIGCGAVLAAQTGITTICDFRTTDVALEGQGAPLVPIGDELLFGQYDACLNLGGFSNISYRKDHKRMAFDISPCNMVLNALAQKLAKEYDENGNMARTGQCNQVLLNELNQLEYYQQLGAKSLGKEWVDDIFFPIIERSPLSLQDKLATVCHHIAYQIARSCSLIPKSQNCPTMLVTGGGANNRYLVELIQSYTSCQIIIPDNLTINFKEAIIFAFLGLLRFYEQNNCLKDVTGAKSDCCGGAIYLKV